MQLFDWRDKDFRERAMVVVTIMALVVLASHPELRVFYLLVETCGLDVLLMLFGFQFAFLFVTYAKPLHRFIAPLSTLIQSWLLFYSPYEAHSLRAQYYHSRSSAT
jgi:hypothetical protein